MNRDYFTTFRYTHMLCRPGALCIADDGNMLVKGVIAGLTSNPFPLKRKGMLKQVQHDGNVLFNSVIARFDEANSIHFISTFDKLN